MGGSKENRQWKMLLGGIAAVVGALWFLSRLLEYISWGGLSYAWSELIWPGALCLFGLGLLFSHLVQEKKRRTPPPPPPKPEGEFALLARIREVNDAIADPVMSEKIGRIEDITGKILDYRKKNPGKEGGLRSFLDYYLPTTLKILRAYAELEAQGVRGENITAGKVRIEGMMDKVVEGFEKQLDRLFQSDSLDIDSDVRVLEQMLRKDGLSGDGDMLKG